MAKVISPDSAGIEFAAKTLLDGNLVCIPTETVYGLSADACNEASVLRIFQVKNRPVSNPLIVHISGKERLTDWAIRIPEYAWTLVSKFWPGPLTIILRKSKLASHLITGNQEYVALRVPDNLITLKLLEQALSLGVYGLAAPSANRFGEVSPTNTKDLLAGLEKYLSSDDLVLEGGKCRIGIESTIIDCTSKLPYVVRPGIISTEEIYHALKIDMADSITNAQLISIRKKNIKSPGLAQKHYSPKAQVSIGPETYPGDGFIAFAEIPTPIGAIRLASPLNIEDFARILYSSFHECDRLGLKRLVIIPPQGAGIASAIRNRLFRAANIPYTSLNFME